MGSYVESISQTRIVDEREEGWETPSDCGSCDLNRQYASFQDAGANMEKVVDVVGM
jgi:hypothetical protein